MPETLKRALLQDETKPKRLKPGDVASRSWTDFQSILETLMRRKCLCEFSVDDLSQHLDPVLSRSGGEESFLVINVLAWLGRTFHEQLLSGAVCARIQHLVNHVLHSQEYLQALMFFVKDGDAYVRHSACEALTSLLPLSYCGQDIALTSSQHFIQDVIGGLKFAFAESPLARISTAVASSQNRRLADVDSSFDSLPSAADTYLTEGEAAELSLDLLQEESSGAISSGNFEQHEANSTRVLSDKSFGEQSALLRILSGFVSHGGSQREENSPRPQHDADCELVELEDEMLCQEFQVKCLILKALQPVWEKFTTTLANVTGESARGSRSGGGGGGHENEQDRIFSDYLTEGFKLWKSLISIRANLNFVDTRSFAANLSLPLYALKSTSPPSVWRSVLETVCECLCYGSTLGLQSIPPEEPCQLAHTIIRLVRFDGFLGRVPYKHSIGMAGLAATQASSPQESEDRQQYDKGMVQKIVLVLLKAVALTTREARVDSSSGESDSSLSSAESGDSCSSDLVIIERNMSGMYKQLDSWIKTVLPLLPSSKLQDNILHLLQEQDDALVEGLLCLLDTHIALHVPGRDNQGLFDTSPTAGLVKLISIVGGDSSVLLDFLVSNETCFLLYLLRLLKFIVKDWNMFVFQCGDSFSSTLGVLMQLKSSIFRLMNKELFPYNIGPVYKLLERAEGLAGINKKNSH